MVRSFEFKTYSCFKVFKLIHIILEKFLVGACGHDEDMIAQATCGGLCEDGGWVYAVRKPCVYKVTKVTCNDICTSNELKVQDSQVAKRM